MLKVTQFAQLQAGKCRAKGQQIYTKSAFLVLLLLLSSYRHCCRSTAMRSIKPWLHVKQNYFEIILKLFRR